jgi:dihydropteroate synthase
VPVEEAEELRRVLPVIRALARQVKVPISIDTMKVGVARASIEAGASIVNDVAAAQNRAEMWDTVSKADVGYVCMHMRGTPQTMQDNPEYQDVVAEVQSFLHSRITALKSAGIDEEKIVLDPGIGFGKTAEHNLQLLGAMRRFTKLGRPVLLGVSRKSFLGRGSGTESDDRVPASLACACLAVEAGVQILRVHDVAATVKAVRITEAILNKRN